MKKNFKNNIQEKTMPSPSPWDFSAPEYDQRSSCFVNAGSHNGVGHRQPVGSKKHTMDGRVPVGKGMGMTVDEIPASNLVLDLTR